MTQSFTKRAADTAPMAAGIPKAASDEIKGPRTKFLKLALLLIATQLYLGLLLFFDWGHGIERGLIVGGALLGLLFLRFGSWASDDQPIATSISDRLSVGLKTLLVTSLIIDFGMAGYTIVRSVRSHEIPMDQGQTTWRAARLLWKGENPYGLGAVVDYYGFGARADARRAEGIVPVIPAAGIEAALSEYDKTLNPAIRDRLLPITIEGGAKPDEARLVGYKYGPLLIDVTALFVPFGIPAIVVLLNAVACFIMLWAMYRLMRNASGRATLAVVGVLALLLDRHISWNYLNETATDVWALAFCALGVLAFRSGRPLATSAAMAIAVGCKIFPSLLFLPLLLQFRSVRSLAVFMGIVMAIYAPWFAWDHIGVFDNVLLWPVVMFKDTTSWLYFAPSSVAIVVRLAALSGIFVLWFRYLTRRETRLFWTLAVSNTLLLGIGGVFHNNYVPWASVWIVAAIVEAFSATGSPILGHGRGGAGHRGAPGSELHVQRHVPDAVVRPDPVARKAVGR
jgi:hypothetical protein